MSKIAKSFVELIGKTPLLAATRFGAKFGADAVQYGRDLRFEHRVSDTMPTGKNEQI